jgi:hypothetical protein
MMRRRLSTIVLAVLVLSAAEARGQSSPAAEGRYTLHRADDGYLRLDGHTGQVSTCTRGPEGWACQAVPDERRPLEAEIGRLQAENAALKKELLARNSALPDGASPAPPATVEAPSPRTPRAPSDPEFKRMMTLAEKVWRRVVEMVMEAQRDLLENM